MLKELGAFLGGTAVNVAVAASRHGRCSAVITRTGDNPFGRFIHTALRQLQVDDAYVGAVDAYVGAVDGLPTPITFCEMQPPDHFPLWFYRWPKAPDREIPSEELDYGVVSEAWVFWATLGGLAQDPSRSAQFEAWDACPERRECLDIRSIR